MNVELALSYSCDYELYVNAKGFMIAQRTATSGSANGKKGKKIMSNDERSTSEAYLQACIVYTYNPQQGQESDYYRYIPSGQKGQDRNWTCEQIFNARKQCFLVLCFSTVDSLRARKIDAANFVINRVRSASEKPSDRLAISTALCSASGTIKIFHYLRAARPILMRYSHCESERSKIKNDHRCIIGQSFRWCTYCTKTFESFVIRHHDDDFKDDSVLVMKLILWQIANLRSSRDINSQRVIPIVRCVTRCIFLLRIAKRPVRAFLLLINSICAFARASSSAYCIATSLLLTKLTAYSRAYTETFLLAHWTSPVTLPTYIHNTCI
ncbi:unnamed protein product [Trichogramma brassicae]|uniref:Uncharacterized protein n=1 Tax=Trichogramma brassicae TaxID=86971 RepID=A0A6H5IHR0_9HYME|nr:unnamed protein product [Trichogramma brassicae]